MALDIAVTWDPIQGRGNWSVANGDLALGNALLSAVMVSLFTDRVAPAQPSADDVAAGLGTPGSQLPNRRGWWGDTYVGRPIGSRLWQLKRTFKAGPKAQTAVPQEAEDICTEALQWLIDEGIAASVAAAAAWATATALTIRVTIAQPGASSPQSFRFQWAWDGLN